MTLGEVLGVLAALVGILHSQIIDRSEIRIYYDLLSRGGMTAFFRPILLVLLLLGVLIIDLLEVARRHESHVYGV